MSNVALQDVYANNLQQNRGYPLRRPNFSSHPEGLRIGDVGHVDETGAFHVHCNIRCPSPSDSDQFQAIQLDKDLICKDATAVLVEHSFFTGVKQRATTQESGIYEFTATAERGAILILPSGATLHDLQDQQTLDEFQELAIKHAHRWCLSTRRNSLYLITGLYQTSSWTLASFHGRRDVDGEKVFVQKSVNHLPVYQWKPEFPNLDSQSCHKDTQFENQTVLIKGFKMTVRPKLGVTIVGPIQGWRNCFELLIECLKCLASQFGVMIPPIGTSIKFDPELYRQPHHLDVVNDYLLETSKADVVISHDDVWIKLLEKSKSMVIQEDELLEHVKGEYNTRSRNNAIWLERRLEDPNGVLAQETESSKPRVVITHICAENVTVGLGYVPVGFFVRVEIDGDISRSTENKPALVDDHNIQWDDRIYLPSVSSTKVRLVLCASFEFSPMLGSGEPIGTLEIRVSDLLERTRPFTIKESRMSRSISLLVSARPWYCKNWMSSRVDDNDRKEHSTLPDVIDLTDEGHHALLGYYRNYNEKDLESSATSFTQALKKCLKDDPRHVVAMFNLAKAEFLSDQFHHAHQHFHHSTSLFKEALRLRAGDHRDRPMTLLYLSQALLYYRASGLQVPQSTLHEYINELETICPRDTHVHRAADVVLQIHELIQLKISDDLNKLHELIPKWVRAADEVPEGYFDKPVRFDNIGLALQRRFQLCYNTIDLKKAVQWFEKAVHITPDGHAQKSTYEDHLSDARLCQWATVVLTGSSANEALDAAVKEFDDVPKSHVYRVICDVLEGSDRVLEAIECFRKMHTPNKRTWEVDFRRRCVKKLEKKGDTLMESKDLDAAIEHYSIALSLDPTIISDIVVKCCKAALLEKQMLINANKFRVYRALCDDLEGRGRVPEATTCFRKMQDELLEMSVPDQAEWEVDFRRRCVTKLEKQGDALMESRNPNAAIESYSIALSLDPTNISDIIVKCCKAGLLRLINVNKFRVYWMRCDDLEGSGRVPEAIACFRNMQDELVETSVPNDRAAWELDFRRRCVDKVDKQGNGAMDSKDRDSAIGYYSCALSLDPTNVNIIVKCCKARIRSLEDKLMDATRAIELDPSYYKGYEKKFTVLHSMGRYREAFSAFEMMLSIMKNSVDPQVHVLRSRYLDTTPLIRKVVNTIGEKPTQTVPGLISPPRDVELPNTSPATVPLFALLIGIDDYPNCRGPSGAVADAQAMREYLEERLGVPDSHVRLLLDCQATRDAIIEAFQDLRNDSRIKQGDPILIYYSGHAGQLPAPQGRGPDSMIQYLLPHDYKSTSIHPIPDRTVGALIEDIANAKGNNITVILDCSYSAGCVRAGLRSHVLLAACSENELAYEHEGRGQFTDAVLSTLNACAVNDLTYAEVIERIRLPKQHPQCVGFNRHCVLFNARVSAVKQVRHIVRTDKGGRYVIGAGLAHGVSYGAEVTLYGDLRSRSAVIVVDDAAAIGDFETTVTIPEEHLKNASFARLTRVSKVPICLAQGGYTSPILKETLRRTVGNRTTDSAFWFVEDPKEAKLEVAMENDLVIFRLLDLRVKRFGLRTLPFTATLDSVARILTAAAHYYWYFDLMNEDYRVGTNHPVVAIDFYPLEKDYDEYGLPFYIPTEPGLCQKDPNLDNSDVIDFIVNPSTLYGIKITNNTQHDLYLNAFLFNTSSFSIVPYYTQSSAGNPEAPLRRNGGTFTIGYGSRGTPPFAYWLAENQEVDVGHLKVFFATRPIDLSDVAQVSPFVDTAMTTIPHARNHCADDGDARKAKLSLSPAEKSACEMPGDTWFAVDVPIVQRRRAAV